jgi:hypothetical protein
VCTRLVRRVGKGIGKRGSNRQGRARSDQQQECGREP